MFSKILQEIVTIQKLLDDTKKPISNKITLNEETHKNPEAQEKIVTLKKQIQEEAGDEAIECLEAILENRLLKNAMEMPSEAEAKAITYAKYVDSSVYQELLPYTQLAHAYEKNGSAQDHALTLTVLFVDTKSALKYLLKNTKNTTLHNACLFALPNPEGCSFSIWQSLAKKYMDDLEFRRILAQAAEIEGLIKADYQTAKDNKIKPNRDEINALKKDIEHNQALWKRLNGHEEERDENLEQYNELSKNLPIIRTKLTHLRAGIPLDNNIDLLSLKCYRERYIIDAGPSYQYLLTQGLSKTDYEKFLKLDRTRAGENIPNIQIDGAELGHPGYYFKKLQVQDEAEAAKAACLGKLTDCCQSLSGETGEPCVIHGLTSPNGGFYIVCKGDISNPQISDVVIAQSWVWRSTTNALVFDSIESEFEEDEIIKIACSFYQKAGKKLCLDNETNTVVCGSNSGISDDISDVLLPNREIFKDYTGYNDSHSQRCIYDTQRPWYLYQQDDELTKKTESFLNAIMQGDKPLLESNLFCEMLNWAMLYNKQFKKIIKSNAENHPIKQEELDRLMTNLTYFIEPELDLHNLKHAVEKGHFYINAINSSGETVMMNATKKDEKELLISLIKQGANIHQQDYKGNTLLHYILQHKPEYLHLVMDSLPKQEWPQALGAINHDGKTALFYAASQPRALQSLLEYYSKEDILPALDISDDNYNTPLYFALSNPESLKLLRTFYPSNEEWLKAISSSGKRVLHQVRDSDLFIELLTDLAPNDRLPALLKQDGEKNTPLFYQSPDIYEKTLNLLPKKQDRALVIQAKNSDDKNLLMNMNVSSHAMLKMLLTTLEEAGENILHQVRDSDLFIKLLTDLPQNDRLPALLKQDGKKNTPLFYQSPDIYEKTLNLLPEKQDRAVVIQAKNREGDNLLCRVHRASDRIATLKMLLTTLAENCFQALQNQTSVYGYTFLHWNQNHSKMLQTICLFLSQNELLQLANITNQNGDTFLSRLNSPKSMKIICRVLSSDMFTILQNQPKFLKTFENNINLLEILLNNLAESDRLPTLLLKNTEGRTIISQYSSNLESLLVILSSLPIKDRKDALLSKGPRFGFDTVIETACQKSIKILRMILSLLPFADIISIVQYFEKIDNNEIEKTFAVEKYKQNINSLPEVCIVTILPILDQINQIEKRIDFDSIMKKDFYKEALNQVVQHELLNQFINHENTKKQILDEITQIKDRLVLAENTSYKDLKIEALADLGNLISNTDAWGECETYGDIFDQWSEEKHETQTHSISNLKLIEKEPNANPSIFSPMSSTGTDIHALINKYKDHKLPNVKPAGYKI